MSIPVDTERTYTETPIYTTPNIQHIYLSLSIAIVFTIRFICVALMRMTLMRVPTKSESQRALKWVFATNSLSTVFLYLYVYSSNIFSAEKVACGST